MASGITVSLNGLDFIIPTTSSHDWGEFSDWCLEVNSSLSNSSDTFIIPAGEANLTNGSAVNLYTINTPSTNSSIILEYNITRITTGGGAVSVGETATLTAKYNSVAGTWVYNNSGVGDASVAISISGANVIQATATALTGTPSVSLIQYQGRIIRT